MLVLKHKLTMNRFIITFGIFSLLLISCKKEYTQSEKNRVEEMLSSNVYKLKVPDDSFVFCLDTIKADEEYVRFSDEYCRRGQEVDSYLYLSSYGVYVPIFVDNGCGIITCGISRRSLRFVVNKKLQWLIEDELVESLSQQKTDSILSEYYLRMKIEKRNLYNMVCFDGQSIKNNIKRDSLYMNFIKGYYVFIKKEKERSGESIYSLRKEFPFNLNFGEYILYPPPAPSFLD